MHTARLGEVAFDEATRVPTFVHPQQQQAAPSLSDWTTGRGPTPMPPWREAREKRFINRERVEHRPPLRERDAWQREHPLDERPPRRPIEEGSRKIRPSSLQKMVKKYDGTSDPHDHVATFRQAIHAEQVRDIHTQVEGFGLTLESKALTWFQAKLVSIFLEGLKDKTLYKHLYAMKHQSLIEGCKNAMDLDGQLR